MSDFDNGFYCIFEPGEKAVRDPVDRSIRELAFIFLLGMVGLNAGDEKEHRMSNKTRTNNPKKQGMTTKERRTEKRAKAHEERHLFTRRKRADRTN